MGSQHQILKCRAWGSPQHNIWSWWVGIYPCTIMQVFFRQYSNFFCWVIQLLHTTSHTRLTLKWPRISVTVMCYRGNSGALTPGGRRGHRVKPVELQTAWCCLWAENSHEAINLQQCGLLTFSHEWLGKKLRKKYFFIIMYFWDVE